MGNGAKVRGEAIAFCGTRGVPANYGGFETAVDEISRRFVESGYDCVVFCRSSSGQGAVQYHEGRKLEYVKGSTSAKRDTFVSSLRAGLHLLRHRREYGHVFWFNNANLPGILLTLLARIPMSVNTDGMEWRRAKWGLPFKIYYLVASFLISLLCGNLISDSSTIQQFYRKTFRKSTHLIPYGVPEITEVPPERQAAILERYGLEPGRYFLQVTRFEPDNLPLENALAFKAAGLAREGFKFLVVGYQQPTPYAQRLRYISGEDGVLVSDAIYDAEVLSTLRRNCFCYVHGNSVGGTNPALLEAMASAPRVLAIEGPFSREVLGDTGYFFEPERMEKCLWQVLRLPDNSALMQERVRARYRWDAVAESYMRLAEGLPAGYLFTGERAEAENPAEGEDEWERSA